MTSLFRSLVGVLVLAVSLASCKSTSSSGATANDRWVFAFLVSGPNAASTPAAERDKLQGEHMANIGRLANEDKLVVAGPFGEERPAAELRGIFIFDTRDVAQAREWTNTDPAVKAGVLAMELAPLHSAAPLRHSLELYREREAAAKAEGRKFKMEESIRPYVMLLAQDARAADKALASLRKQQKVVMEGRLDDSPRGKWLVVLDAPDVASATEMLGDDRKALGEHTLSSWWASMTLAAMNEPAK